VKVGSNDHIGALVHKFSSGKTSPGENRPGTGLCRPERDTGSGPGRYYFFFQPLDTNGGSVDTITGSGPGKRKIPGDVWIFRAL